MVTTEVRSASFGLVLHVQHIFANCLLVHGAPWWVLLQHSITLQRVFFIVECGIKGFLCAMCVFEVRASSLSLGYLCAKVHFFRALLCWASPWRKITYSLTHSLTHWFTQLIWCPGNRSLWFGLCLNASQADSEKFSEICMTVVGTSNFCIPGDHITCHNNYTQEHCARQIPEVFFVQCHSSRRSQCEA